MEPLRKQSDPMTADEFHSWPGDGRGGKYQLVDGELRAMPPASAVHGAIQANLARMVGSHLAAVGSTCREYSEPAIEVRINAAINTRIPDLGVSSARLTPQDFALPDPILLIEILSPGNNAGHLDQRLRLLHDPDPEGDFDPRWQPGRGRPAAAR